MFAGPRKLGEWPAGVVGLVAPFSLTHRKPPAGNKLWPHDATTGDFRASATTQPALDALRAALAQVGARCAVFRSPETFSPSAANRELVQGFFARTPLDCERVWIPGGLWEPLAALKLAGELGITCAIDPLARQPGDPIEIFYDLDAPALYFRIERGGALGAERLDDLAALCEHYEDRSVIVAFATRDRWQDARKLRDLLS